jgi:phosphate transport system substrate-binding protein
MRQDFSRRRVIKLSSNAARARLIFPDGANAMTKRHLISLTAILSGTAMLAACGGAQNASREQIRVVGSSTVLPFAKLVAEAFAKENAGSKAPIIEGNGTGGGMKLFCAGVGISHPDIEDASRRIKKSEFDDCVKNGVKDVVEVQVGIDGIAFANAKNGPSMALTPVDVYKAIAANPFGKPNTAKSWQDVNPALPDMPIQVYGPATISGTRDALKELILTKGCDSDPTMKAIKDSDKGKHDKICGELRSDGAYADTSDNYNLNLWLFLSRIQFRQAQGPDDGRDCAELCLDF